MDNGIELNMSMHIYQLEIIRLLTGFILLFAAWGKASAFTLFQRNLTDSFRVPASLAFLTALIIMLTEIIISVRSISRNIDL